MWTCEKREGVGGDRDVWSCEKREGESGDRDVWMCGLVRRGRVSLGCL